jgi:hypothetical protein
MFHWMTLTFSEVLEQGWRLTRQADVNCLFHDRVSYLQLAPSKLHLMTTLFGVNSAA